MGRWVRRSSSVEGLCRASLRSSEGLSKAASNPAADRVSRIFGDKSTSFPSSPQSYPELLVDDVLEQLESLQRDLMAGLTSLVDEFMTLSKAEVRRLTCQMRPTLNNHISFVNSNATKSCGMDSNSSGFVSSNSIGGSERTHMGEGVVYHMERKWGIIDLGNHDHVFFDLSILLGTVDDLRCHFEVGERIGFEAIKAQKPSRANWKATNVWKLLKPSSVPSSRVLSPTNNSYISLPSSNHFPSTFNTPPFLLNHTCSDTFAQNARKKIVCKKPIASCGSTPLLGNWRSRKQNQVSFNESTPVSPLPPDLFRFSKNPENGKQEWAGLSRHYSSSATPGLLAHRLAPSYRNEPPSCIFNFSSALMGFANSGRASANSFLRPPSLQKVDLPTLESDSCIIDEFNSRRILKKDQQQHQKQLQNQQQILQQPQQNFEQRLLRIEKTNEMLRLELQQIRSNSPKEVLYASAIFDENNLEKEGTRAVLGNSNGENGLKRDLNNNQQEIKWISEKKVQTEEVRDKKEKDQKERC